MYVYNISIHQQGLFASVCIVCYPETSQKHMSMSMILSFYQFVHQFKTPKRWCKHNHPNKNKPTHVFFSRFAWHAQAKFPSSLLWRWSREPCVSFHGHWESPERHQLLRGSVGFLLMGMPSCSQEIAGLINGLLRDNDGLHNLLKKALLCFGKGGIGGGGPLGFPWFVRICELLALPI